MNHNVFLYPEIIQDTPRLFTAIAEWLAVFIYSQMYKRRISGAKYAITCALNAVIIIAFQYVAGILPLGLWLISMFVAVVLMFFFMLTVAEIKPVDCGVLTVHAFVLAEFTASFYRQLYVWHVYFSGLDSFVMSLCYMVIIYTATALVYFNTQKKNIPNNRNLNCSKSELISVVATGVGVFAISNISFVWTQTPFSVTSNLLYVRTLVDFGGILMLMTQMNRRTELLMKEESDSINMLLRKQYEQYKLAVDNSELLRKEMHDMKHYLAALKGEEDPKKREEVLADMEQAIAIQESFMNTGNQILDVILTTKSLQCEKKGITLKAMVDGDVLSGIHVKDICSLFGNMLDNAIEATQEIGDREKRLISLDVRQRNDFIIIECENYTVTDFENDSKQENTKRFFTTTKSDKVHHGFGLKSIQQVAEKYGGAMTVKVENNWFKVKVLLSVNN